MAAVLLAWLSGMGTDSALAADAAVASPCAEDLSDATVVGRFAVTSEAGDAVWAFQPGGQLVVVGPGDLMASGSWTPGPGVGDIDADLEIGITGQSLEILGAVAPDGQRLALHVTASDPLFPGDGVPWPAVSRLVGERLGLLADPTPSPSPTPLDCLRPAWGPGDTVDWDRCEAAMPPSPLPTG